jgi:hypothetical protein
MVMPVSVLTDPGTQNTSYVPFYDQALIYRNGTLISDTVWNPATQWWSFNATYSPFFNTSPEAVLSMEGDYSVRLLKSGTHTDLSFSLGAISVSPYSNTALTSDLWQLAHNQTNTMSWTSGLANPDYIHASGQAGSAPFQYGDWTQEGVSNLSGATSMTENTITFGSPFQSSGLFQVSVSMGQSFNVSSSMSNLVDPANLMTNVMLREYSTRLVMADSAALLPNTAVPEPSSYGLLGGGILATLAWVRRRRAAAKRNPESN